MVKKNAKEDSRKTHHKDRVVEFTNTLEWLITAFILAFVFRTFVMEAYRIPTGSMASTLKGDHYKLCCPQCGHGYDHGSDSGRNNNAGKSDVMTIYSRCPSCGYYLSTKGVIPIAKGDRILVLKCIYQFFEPKRWDVTVFKNPLNPKINYIKRLIALPTEIVEIIDGDIYINGKMERKPPKVQDELWMPVYNNDYQPVRPNQGVFNGHFWQQPFDTFDSNWQLDPNNPTIFRLNSPAEQINTMVYDTLHGNDFRVTYAYNDVRSYKYMPFCSDLMVRFFAHSLDKQTVIGTELSKYLTNYRASVNPAGDMIIEKLENGKQAVVLARKTIEPAIASKPTLVKFANVDHRLIFQYGDEELIHDLGRFADDAGPREAEIEPQVKVFGSGKLALSHVAIFRDIHYTGSIYGSGQARALEGDPFTLKEDQFFVLGDNSPNSEDGRWWKKSGIANKGLEPYDAGIVPRDYLVGKALFVYWPSGFEFPWPRSLRELLYKKSRHNPLFKVADVIVSLNWIPNVGQMRFIYGGSSSDK